VRHRPAAVDQRLGRRAVSDVGSLGGKDPQATSFPTYCRDRDGSRGRLVEPPRGAAGQELEGRQRDFGVNFVHDEVCLIFSLVHESGTGGASFRQPEVN
jgi:hypothetical protein